MGECESHYWTYVDGEHTEVVTLEESFRSVKAHIESVEKRNKYLIEENEKLKDEHFKDKTIAEMQEKLDKAMSDLYRGFPISEEEAQKIKEWAHRHDEEVHGADYANGKYRYGGAIGGSYSYHFTPTSIGTVGTVKCTCGAEFTFQEL